MASLVEKNDAIISFSESLAKRRAIYGEESRLGLRRASSGPKRLFARLFLILENRRRVAAPRMDALAYG